MKLERALTAGLLLFVACKFEASCGTAELDMENVRSMARNMLEAERIPVESITCPDGIEPEKGADFECKARVQGEGAVELTVDVAQKDDEGNVELTLADPVVVSGKLEEQIEQGFQEQAGIEPTVDCGQRVRIHEEGERFRCTAHASDRAMKVEVVMEKGAGNVEWEVVN